MDNLNCSICENKLIKPNMYLDTYDCLNCGSWFNTYDANNIFIKGLKLNDFNFLCYDEFTNEIKIITDNPINSAKYIGIIIPQTLIELRNDLEIYNFFKRIKDSMEFL